MTDGYPQFIPSPDLVPATVSERRAHPRRSVSVEAKVIAPGWARYAAARTGDLSEGGALLRLSTPESRLIPGQRVRVAIGGTGVVRAADLREASVVRVGAGEVALRFEQTPGDRAA